LELVEAELRGRFAAARVARLATVGETGRPHLVPITFALVGDVVVTAVDHKPKTTTDLVRLRNVRATGRVSMLVDDYDDADWSRLWWVRLDGSARVIERAGECGSALEWLAAKYRQYRDDPPTGPVVWIDVDTVRGWTHTPEAVRRRGARPRPRR